MGGARRPPIKQQKQKSPASGESEGHKGSTCPLTCSLRVDTNQHHWPALCGPDLCPPGGEGQLRRRRATEHRAVTKDKAPRSPVSYDRLARERRRAPGDANVTVTPTTRIMPTNVTDGAGSSVWNRAEDLPPPRRSSITPIKSNARRIKVLQLC